MTHLEGSLAWFDQGCSIIPIFADGTKKPQGKWTEYMTTRAPRERVEKWFSTSPKSGIGIVCGAVSGNLEMLEIEAARMDSDSLDKVADALIRAGVHELWEQLTTDYGYCETTPSGGIHILYRITDQPVPGNQKIALDVTGKKTYAETRGEGGFVVVAPSSGTVHKSGQAWTAIAGSPGMALLSITWEQRQKIHAALKEALDERVLPVYERPAAAPYDRSQGQRPGDAYDNDPSVTVHDILLRNGWKYLGKSGGQDRYVHPLSSDMTTHSACTGHKGSPNLYAWSGLPKEDFYTKFGLLAHLEFNGDFSEATRWLRSQGYGDPLPPRGPLDVDDWGWDDDEVTEKPETSDEKGPAFLKEWTETGVAHYMVARFGNRYRYVGEENGWRVYENGRWVPDERSAVSQAAEKAAEFALDKAKEAVRQAEENEDKDEIRDARALLAAAKSFRSARGTNAIVTRFSQQAKISARAHDFDVDNMLLCLNNGTFNMRTMTLEPHSPDHMLTKSIDVTYDPDAQCPGFLKFLAECVPDEDYRTYLNRALGMSVTGKVREAAFIVLHGPTGCGKSQFVKVAHSVLGEYAATAASGTFRESRRGNNDTYDLHDLRGSRMASMSETSEGDVLNEELLKRITGGDNIKSRTLFQKFIEWKPQFTVWVATNFLPRLNVNDDAIWRRVKVVKFPNQFKGDAAEIGLADRLVETELAGIFNWMIQGVREYLEVGLKEPASMSAHLEEYRSEVDPVTEFLEDILDEGTLFRSEEASISSTELYRVYSNWAQLNGKGRPITQNRLARRLDVLGYTTGRGTGGVRMRNGLGLNKARGIAESQGYGRF
jgi:P4 family phage/plasmid primase-like protien